MKYIKALDTRYNIIDEWKEENGLALWKSPTNVWTPSVYSNIDEALKIIVRDNHRFQVLETKGFAVNISSNDTVASKVMNVLVKHANKTCTHEFKQYIGMKEQFDYCVKCDFKRG